MPDKCYFSVRPGFFQGNFFRTLWFLLIVVRSRKRTTIVLICRTSKHNSLFMRKVIYSVAASLDGYIAGPNGEFDWIPDEPAIDWKAFMGRFDTVLMGRHTYEVAGAQGSSSKMRSYVFSRTLHPEEHPSVTIVAEEAEQVVGALREEDGKDIWLFGGGVLFRSLLQAGLVDAVEVGLVPVLLGRGLPLLPDMPGQTRLRLTHTKQYPSGIILLNYDVVQEGS
jgi:dihydrofolate reductase